ncbi:MAG: sensor domain-containing diguanylate cyclase, partial [Solirubrobacterales bacterium]|nr:sensor domain-containing diguanylate cyclase [Solirubrobacterales bacterium]
MREQWEHEALLRVATAASGASSLDDVIEETSEEARRAVGAASLSVSRFEKRDRQLHTLINVGELGPGEQRHPVDEAYSADDYPLVAAMLETACPYFNTLDDPYCDPMARQLLEQFGKGSDLGVPVRVEGSTWGEIWATKAVNEAPFSAEDVAFLEAIAGQYATVIARAELFSTVSRLAYEDPLTGLPNRRALDERLGRAIARARVKHDPLSLLLCDLDGLKGINDVRGHHAGDEALRAAADALVASTAFTPGSFVARLAGDEFCVVLEGIELADAVATGAAAIETLAAPGDPGLSLSCGAAAIDAGMSSAGDLLRGADTALYVAKRRGGGRVCSVAEERGEPSPRRPVGTSVGAPAHGLIVSATEQLAAELDGRLADAPALDRLEAVATAFTESGDFASWAISVSPAGTKLIADVSFGNNRDGSVRGVRVAAGTDEYALSDFPVTAALVDAGSGCFVASRSDPGSDPAERALLEELGYERVIGVAAADESDVYMIELYGDERTCSLDEVEAPLRLAARAAIPPRTRDGAASKRQVRR